MGLAARVRDETADREETPVQALATVGQVVTGGPALAMAGRGETAGHELATADLVAMVVRAQVVTVGPVMVDPATADRGPATATGLLKDRAVRATAVVLRKVLAAARAMVVAIGRPVLNVRPQKTGS